MKERLDILSKAVICIIGCLALGYVFLKYLLVLFLPFFFAWGMAFAVRTPAKGLSRRTGIPARIWRALLSVAISGLMLFLLGFLVWKLLSEGWRILARIGSEGEVLKTVERVMNPRGALSGFLPEGLSEVISLAADGAVAKLSSAFGDFAARLIGALPSFFLFIVISLIACVYFALDLERVNTFVKGKLPNSVFSALVKFKASLFGVGIKYARAYILIMLLTFAICLTGLLLLGVEYALLIAVLISVLDILPVIGIGTIFVPWAVFQLVFGSRALGFGLIILFLIAEFIRQLAEPKIMGKSLGLHPIVSLVLLYGSYSLFGLLGILLIPCAVVVINALVRKNNAPEVAKRTVGEGDDA